MASKIWFGLVFIALKWCTFEVECGGILYPQESETREVKSLDGIWQFLADDAGTEGRGFGEKWHLKQLNDVGKVELMPVPSSFNDITQNKAVRDHIGWVWYARTFWMPQRWRSEDRRVFIRFGSANYHAVVWVNGQHATNHTGGYLPFVADVTKLLQYGQENYITVALNNTLDHGTVPQGTLQYPSDRSRYPEGFVIQGYNFDYFNFAGIHRPVYLYTTPPSYINDVTIITDFKEASNETLGLVKFTVKYHASAFPSSSSLSCLVAVRDDKNKKVGVAQSCSDSIEIHNAKLWWPYLSAPKGEREAYLYTLEVYLTSGDEKQFEGDVYRLKFGIRTAQVVNDTFLINRKPFYFRGFGRHEDYSLRGRGVDNVMLVKDHNLIMWTGANSYRTSHYPYAEEILDLTDKLGIVIIDESPAIGLTGFGEALCASHIQVMKELVRRDKNRASVVMWSIGNEPKSLEAPATNYFNKVINATRRFDKAGRPITIVVNQGFSNHTAPDLDVVSINRYFAWYGDTGRSEVIKLQIPTEVKSWYKSYKKPVLISEYGAGSVAGMHQNPSFVWTEDYQTDYLIQHFKAFDELREEVPYFIGEMIWNFADFATPQETFRPWGCMKGIFTRERQPKQAAHVVRLRYWTLANQTGTFCDDKQMPTDLNPFRIY
ncbi:Beta-glucuronidase [Orchesella cincta]|uniref:Beta-glucuronidase n=1 Tax=Orchesella cincta TaxID=48709 RepID=A0A1D2NMD6_ORCCI|nr:Beta-glucuronidase [Orchesella cincta]